MDWVSICFVDIELICSLWSEKNIKTCCQVLKYWIISRYLEAFSIIFLFTCFYSIAVIEGIRLPFKTLNSNISITSYVSVFIESVTLFWVGSLFSNLLQRSETFSWKNWGIFQQNYFLNIVLLHQYPCYRAWDSFPKKLKFVMWKICNKSLLISKAV